MSAKQKKASIPTFCRACGYQGTIHTWLNQETGELTVECTCGEVYPDVEPEPVMEMLTFLGLSLDAEEHSYEADPS